MLRANKITPAGCSRVSRELRRGVISVPVEADDQELADLRELSFVEQSSDAISNLLFLAFPCLPKPGEKGLLLSDFLL